MEGSEAKEEEKAKVNESTRLATTVARQGTWLRSVGLNRPKVAKEVAKEEKVAQQKEEKVKAKEVITLKVTARTA